MDKQAEEFIICCKENNLHKAKEFILNGINVNYQDKFGATALILICCYNYNDLLKLILKQPSINLNLQEFSKGRTALMIAMQFENIDAVLELLKYNSINLKIKNKEGKTVFDIVKENKNEFILNQLNSKLKIPNLFF